MCDVVYPGPPLSQGEDQIRLLTVLAGHPDDPIKCMLDTGVFADIKTAEALSYAWGISTCQKAISINGASFDIGENLFEAIVHLRLPTTRRLLWIDALCINQSDTAERNHQVRMMAAIYSGAYRVLVWLGLETASSKEAFDFVRSAYQRSPYNREELKNDQGWLVLEELCNREYWGRVWIVQEICLASRLTLCCGTSQMPWVYLSELRRCRKNIWPRYMSRGEQAFMRSLPARIDQQKASRDKNGDCSLWTLLEAFQGSQCKEVHDKVYGFMGLSTDCGSTGIPIDYSKSAQQLYDDVILFYYQRFRNKSFEQSSPSAAQLISLSEFLQSLLACHIGMNLRQDLQHAKSESVQNSAPDGGFNFSTVNVEVSAFSTLVVDKFLSSSDATQYSATSLVQFLNGEIPYSHLGFWRDFVDHNVSGVYAIEPSPASLIYHETTSIFEDRSESEAISQSSVFIASRVTRKLEVGEDTNRPETEYVIGIAPPGCRRGDLVCTFVDSRMVLIARPCPITVGGVPRATADNHRAPMLRGTVFRPLVGRAVIDMSRSTWVPAFKSLSNLDKSIQVTQVQSHVDKREIPWQATLVVDLPTLQRLTTPMSEFSPTKDSYAATFDLLPIRRHPSLIDQDSNDATSAGLLSSILDTESLSIAKGKTVAPDYLNDSYDFDVGEPADRTNAFDRKTDEDEMKRLREDPELRRHALGPGYGGIINLGSTGYLSCALQIYYMVKPFRDAILQSSDTKGSLILIELQKLFRHLHSSSLPASPLGLTKSFGWSESDLQKPQDVGMFIEDFHDILKDIGGAVFRSFEAMFVGEWSFRKRSPETFSYIGFSAMLGSLGAGIAEHAAECEYRRLPTVLIVKPMFRFYDRAKEALEIVSISLAATAPLQLCGSTLIKANTWSSQWRGRFEYPRVFQPSDFLKASGIAVPVTTTYQLLGVIVLEEVQPVPRWLLYLRPRRDQDRWLLFFNDAVTFAREREVFEDNFGGDGVAPGTPLRIPYVLVYALVDKLGEILG